MPSLRITTAALLTLALGYSSAADLAAAATIGVVAPKSGPYALLGQQIFQGARAAANGNTIVEIDESCDEAGGAAAAKALTDAGAKIAVGFLCVETLASAMPALTAVSVPAITIAVRSRILMEDARRNGWPLLRMAPSDGIEADRIAAAITERWKAEPIAFIDDGTIYGRELVSAVRQKLEPFGISPVFTDTLRPGQEQQIALIRRLQKAGATHVLIGADRNDVAIVARDAEAENVPMTVLGGDVMRAADRPVELRDGVLAVALPDYESLPDAAQAVAALRAGGVEPDGDVLPAYAAVQIAARMASGTGVVPIQAFLDTRFDTVIGEIAFGPDHELIDNPYRLLEWRGTAFVPVDPINQTD